MKNNDKNGYIIWHGIYYMAWYIYGMDLYIVCYI